jgi:tRNA U54 and U55 pseudouridine synthase Pus10
VHGDLGRTEPSICTILDKECDILELDVEVDIFVFVFKMNFKI